MKAKKIIKSLLYIFILLFIILIVVSIYLLISNKYKKNNEENIIIKDANNDLINYNQIDINNIGSDSPIPIEIDEANPDKIDYEGQIKRIKLSISNVSNEYQEYIKDKESFAYTIKKYFYENGLLDGNIISLIKCEIQNNEMIMYFKLNNNSSTIIKVVYNFDQNSTKVSEQK